MTIAAALAITGGILAVVTISLGAIYIDGAPTNPHRIARIGWTTAALAATSLIAAVWTTALT